MRWYILLKSFLPSLGADEEAKDAADSTDFIFLYVIGVLSLDLKLYFTAWIEVEIAVGLFKLEVGLISLLTEDDCY